MATIAFIVGPSGVGKTTTCSAATRELPEWLTVDLDELAGTFAHRTGLIPRPDYHELNRILGNAQKYLDIGLKALDALGAQDKEHCLAVDVGAGFQVAAGAIELHKRHPTITITADPSVAYKRIKEARNDRRTLQGYIQEEFNDRRAKVYNASHHRIDTSGRTIEEAVAELAAILKHIGCGGVTEQPADPGNGV